MSDRIIL